MTRRSTAATSAGALLVSGGIVATGHVYYGTPEPVPAQEVPFAVVRLRQFEGEQITMGAAGTWQDTYDIVMRVYVGAQDTPQADAEALQYQYADLFRYAFSPATVGTGFAGTGTPWQPELLGGEDNIDTFRETGDAPWVEYRLRVTEHVAANAAAG